MNSSTSTLISPGAWEELELYLIFSSFSPFSFPSLSFLAPLEARHKYASDCLKTLFWGSSRSTVAGCWGDAPHALPSPPSSTAEGRAPGAAVPHLLLLSFSHPIIIHHRSQETCALLSEKLLSLWKLFMSFLFSYKALKMYNSHDVFSFIINLSTGTNFCTFLHVL